MSSESLIKAINATKEAADEAIDLGDFAEAAELTKQAQGFADAYEANVR